MSELREQLSEEQKIQREELDRSFRAVLATPSGKRVMFWMLEQCAIYRDADCGENTHLTSTTLGEQRVGRKLIAKLDEIDPRAYPSLLLDMAEITAMDRAAAVRRTEKQGIEDDDIDA
jgi:hypothetical protein